MKVRRIHRENREASITPALVRRLIIVAAQKGFYEAQLNIRKELQGLQPYVAPGGVDHEAEQPYKISGLGILVYD